MILSICYTEKCATRKKAQNSQFFLFFYNTDNWAENVDEKMVL